MADKRKVIYFIITTVFVGFAAYLIFVLRSRIMRIITPFIMAIIIAYLLSPMVERLKRKKIPCNMSILLIYAFFLLLVISIIVFIIPELVQNTRELLDILPELAARYQSIFNNMLSFIRSSNWSPEIKEAIFREIENGARFIQGYSADMLRRSLSGLVRAITAMTDFIVAMIIAYYFIKDAEFFRETTLSLVPRGWRTWLVSTGREINAILSSFIQGQMLTALIIAVLETIGLLIAGIKYPLMLGVVGGIANIIPYFGPILGAIPAVAVALIESPVKAVWAAIVFIIVQQIDNAFISPKIIEGRLGLHPVTTILAVIVGGEFFGITGMLLSVPSVAVIKALIKKAVEAIA
ncbi:MAG: AI-2E family transporter [Clostridia bacterium]|nr:AI-2E family transporter [Clostridia bacterium]